MDLLRAHALAVSLLADHGLTDWRVEFDRARRRAGQCRYADKVVSLSGPLTVLHDEALVRDTVLHEIAHALAGPRAGHGPVWREVATRIGCTGLRCVPEDAPRVAAPWQGFCRKGHVVERHKRPTRVASCKECHPGAFSIDHLFEWTFHGRPAQHHPNYLAELEGARRGRLPVVLPVGANVRITVPGQFQGRVGTVVKRGRTSYHVSLPEVMLRVLFAGVEPVGAEVAR